MILGCGTPEEIAAMPQSHTGRFLAPLLGRDQAVAPAPKPGRKRKTASR
jgi:excinuclease ABC subunit A